jgi:hypothetical protein
MVLYLFYLLASLVVVAGCWLARCCCCVGSLVVVVCCSLLLALLAVGRCSGVARCARWPGLFKFNVQVTKSLVILSHIVIGFELRRVIYFYFVMGRMNEIFIGDKNSFSSNGNSTVSDDCFGFISVPTLLDRSQCYLPRENSQLRAALFFLSDLVQWI